MFRCARYIAGYLLAGSDAGLLARANERKNTVQDALLRRVCQRGRPSLRSETRGGIGEGGFDGLEADGEQGEEEHGGGGGDEEQRAEGDAIGEAPEPVVHGPPGQGKSQEDRQKDEAEEVAGEEEHDAAGRCAEDLADADLFKAALGGKGDETKEAETGDEDRETAEIAGQDGDPLFGDVLGLEVVVEEWKSKGKPGLSVL
jgi:hypothetical protein